MATEGDPLTTALAHLVQPDPTGENPLRWCELKAALAAANLMPSKAALYLALRARGGRPTKLRDAQDRPGPRRWAGLALTPEAHNLVAAKRTLRALGLGRRVF